ncbi:GNAT family N-acetyltransferase [Ornithinimicrobium sediminis]|uniref:GNAT family N-acetyltransferase n=1 Tax=Ornithinimicrobium sediminis TaxID=2904603 RepID=UPI001E52292E|nr:GNAT family N-acetyltransferase [Ornithinimicrobium sediminis]MCE0487443.1 GNAT family N-acetyltransferase [Ornithinimicrobium sediminis]
MDEPVVHASRFEDLTPRQLYDLLRLRVDVFVVEQDCPYPELDGRDTEPDAEQLWVDVDGEVAATVRVLSGEGCRQIGRVATARAHRGKGYAARLMREAIDRIGEQPVEIGAQAYLEEWYGRFGFVRSGEDYLEDGILHLPMRREPSGAP